MARPSDRNRGCARTVFIVGNDGSGKTTFTAKLTDRSEGMGFRVTQRRYYGSLVRVLFRQIIESLTGASRRKTETTENLASAPLAKPAAKTSMPNPARQASGGPRGAALLAFLWVYQTAIGIETRWRDLFSSSDLQIVDRSFIDDLVSIGQTLRVDIPVSLLRYSCWLFPIRRLYFLSAGDDVEFARIADLDLTEAFHTAKGEQYRRLIAEVEPWVPGLRRISTAPRRSPS